jgi:hypothetical protein
VKRVLTLIFAIAVVALGDRVVGVPLTPTPSGQQPSPPAPTRSEPTRSEKDARTPAQQKINSQLLQEIYRRRGESKEKNVPSGPTSVRVDDKDRALVDIRADVAPALEKKVRDLGSTIVSTSREYRSIIAWVPVLKIERLAADASVRAVEPAPESTTHK